MTRQDVLKIFPTATEDQITAYLNAVNSELNAEKEKSKNLKDTSKELEDAKKELDELRAKAENGAPDDWQAQFDKLKEANEKAQRTIKNMEIKNSMLSKGFEESDIDDYLKAVNEGGDITEILGRMKDNAISAHDKKRLENTPNPKGSGAGSSNEKDTAEKLVESIYGGSKPESQADILANYK